MNEVKDAYIVLEDGQTFKGKRIGSDNDVTGELVFSTSVTGFNKSLTDPAYYGQIVLNTFPCVGNCGYITEDFQGDGVGAFGILARDLCSFPSNYRSDGNFNDILKKFGIAGIEGTDTRRITSIVREKGSMNACICSDPRKVDRSLLRSYTVCREDFYKTQSKEVKLHKAENELCTVALLDYGCRRDLITALTDVGISVKVFPGKTAGEEILSAGVDGVVLSPGPGDPKESYYESDEVKKYLGKLPIFGVGLGHQILALAAGADTVKLKCGHRGSNHPVTELDSERTFITTQNHSYCVVSESLFAAGGRVTHKSANDRTCQGAEYPELNAFSLQYYPQLSDIPDRLSGRTAFVKFRDIVLKAKQEGGNFNAR